MMLGTHRWTPSAYGVEVLRYQIVMLMNRGLSQRLSCGLPGVFVDNNDPALVIRTVKPSIIYILLDIISILHYVLTDISILNHFWPTCEPENNTEELEILVEATLTRSTIIIRQ